MLFKKKNTLWKKGHLNLVPVCKGGNTILIILTQQNSQKLIFQCKPKVLNIELTIIVKSVGDSTPAELQKHSLVYTRVHFTDV